MYIEILTKHIKGYTIAKGGPKRRLEENIQKKTHLISAFPGTIAKPRSKVKQHITI